MSEVNAANLGVTVIAPLDFTETVTLRPGVDYHDGITYFTIPSKINTTKVEGKGKNAKEVPAQVEGLALVSSSGLALPFTPEYVEPLGFTFPDNVVLTKERRWSRESVERFLAGKAKVPSPAELHTTIRTVYEQYIDFANEAYFDMLPLFVMGSYMFRLFKSIGYLHFNGTAASGKSQNLRILDALAFNTYWASSMSAAALYRTLAGMPGLVVLDEAEGWEGERGEELRRILNAGYLDGQKVRRMEKGANDQFQVAAFDSFGPKAIASINPLDAVIGSRCIIVAMRPALKPIPEFDKDEPRWQNIRDELYLWTLHHSENVAALVDAWNNGIRNERATQLIGRQWQITQLYIVLADYIDTFDGGDRCNRLIAFFNGYFADLQKQQDATDRIRIVLKCLPRVLANHPPHDGGWFFLKTIHEVVTGVLDPDAVEYYKTRTLGKHLDVLGFKNKRSRKNGTQVWIDPQAVRNELRQRRVEPYEEDIAWFNGEVEYDPATPAPAAPDEPDDNPWSQYE